MILKITLILVLAISLVACGKPKHTVAFEASTEQRSSFYCGVLTKEGKPCRNKVKSQGAHCRLHERS